MTFKDLSKNSVACILFSVVMVWIYFINGSVPEKKQLSNFDGNIEWVKLTGKYNDTVRFKFLNADTHFIYHSISGSVGLVNNTLLEPEAKIQILYDQSDSHSPIGDNHEYYSVYEISKNGSTVKTYNSVAKSYEKNSELGFWLLIIGLILSFVFLAMDFNISRDAN